MRGDQLNLRTAQDAKEQARELALIAQLEQEMENPFHRLGHLFTATAFKVYWEHLYISGILCLWTVWWGAYPAFARFRHRHLCRYRKKQVIFRRWFFSTQNIPKWRVDHENRAWPFWAGAFGACRVMQDLTDMPDMPDLVQ